MMRYSLLLVLGCCWLTVVRGDDDKVNENNNPSDDRVESSFYCLTVKPNVEMKINSSSLSYGKWIENPDGEFTEIQAPDGIVVAANDKKKICSSGRSWSPTGTTGHVRLQLASDDTKTVKIWWSVTFAGALTHGSEGDRIFDVSNQLYGPQHYVWTIKKKP